VFVALLITQVSGVPILEKKADNRWGGQEDYGTYKERTPVLIPRPPATRGSSRTPLMPRSSGAPVWLSGLDAHHERTLGEGQAQKQ
jgi:hypothetical protein